MHVIGRRLFDHTDGWGGRDPFDKPIIVVTHSVPQEWVRSHPDAPFTFVTDGVPSAIDGARIAGDRNVSVTAGTGAGAARRYLDRPRPRAARLGCAVLRGAGGIADPSRRARPDRRGVARDAPAVSGPSLLMSDVLRVDGRTITVTHGDRVVFPDSGSRRPRSSSTTVEWRPPCSRTCAGGR